MTENTTNSRNGYNFKQVNTSLGKVQVNIPRDREKDSLNQRLFLSTLEISLDIEDKIYGRGMIISEINVHL